MLWMVYGKVAFAVLQLVILGILARLLVPADFGVIAAAEVVIGFSAIVSQLGLGPALVQRPELDDRHVETAFTASLGADGQWMLETLRAFIRRLRPSPPVEPVLAVAAE
jgi:O-antigen/teichoic acid export membrane protein